MVTQCALSSYTSRVAPSLCVRCAFILRFSDSAGADVAFDRGDAWLATSRIRIVPCASCVAARSHHGRYTTHLCPFVSRPSPRVVCSPLLCRLVVRWGGWVSVTSPKNPRLQINAVPLLTDMDFLRARARQINNESGDACCLESFIGALSEGRQRRHDVITCVAGARHAHPSVLACRPERKRLRANSRLRPHAPPICSHL